MNEYISREEAIKELREVYEYEYPTASGDFDEYASHDVPNVLRNMPVADVQPVKRGKWVWKERHRNSYRVVKGIDEYGKEGNLQIHEEYKEQVNYCPECGKQGHEIFLNYCPNCGANMRETKEGLKMKTQTYVKVKPSCNNCVHQCGVQLMSKESPRWYCNKHGYNKEELPEERTCSDFEFDTSIVKPSVDSHDVLFKMDDE